MSDLETVKELLDKGCFCHSSDLAFVFECMPETIFHGKLESDCDGSYCFHKKETLIKEKLQEFKRYMETQSRFKVGDRVELAETPEITEKKAWGWLGSKHYLIEGAKATIKEVSYYNGHFGYDISVDSESWKDQQGVLHPRSNKRCQIPGCDFTHGSHTYYFRENQLRPVIGERCSFLSKLWTEFYKIGD